MAQDAPETTDPAADAELNTASAVAAVTHVLFKRGLVTPEQFAELQAGYRAKLMANVDRSAAAYARASAEA
jgi:hypothetical protein